MLWSATGWTTVTTIMGASLSSICTNSSEYRMVLLELSLKSLQVSLLFWLPVEQRSLIRLRRLFTSFTLGFPNIYLVQYLQSYRSCYNSRDTSQEIANLWVVPKLKFPFHPKVCKTDWLLFYFCCSHRIISNLMSAHPTDLDYLEECFSRTSSREHIHVSSTHCSVVQTLISSQDISFLISFWLLWPDWHW